MEEMNYLRCEFAAVSKNEASARAIVASFLVGLDPTVDELTDLKTAVSEAVTNSVIHGYGNIGEVFGEREASGETPVVEMICRSEGRKAVVTVKDRGCGIKNIEEARQPLFTSAPQLERSGLGFSIMESFCDSLEVYSEPGKGTEVILTKVFENQTEG